MQVAVRRRGKFVALQCVLQCVAEHCTRVAMRLQDKTRVLGQCVLQCVAECCSLEYFKAKLESHDDHDSDSV